jgi:NAD(P)-dependent dehydrogenase (short-subunit alcohol dehydrogenase family)
MNDTPTALVTGGGKGLGQEIARRLGLLGMTALLGSRGAARPPPRGSPPAASPSRRSGSTSPTRRASRPRWTS